MKKILLSAVYVVALVFVASGAFNYGMTGFFWAVPPAMIALIIGWHLSGRKGLSVTLAYCGLALLINFTLERNPFVFPILNDGWVTVEKDGYLAVDERGVRTTMSLKSGILLKIIAPDVRHWSFLLSR